jgi:signal transduction histidine kinase
VTLFEDLDESQVAAATLLNRDMLLRWLARSAVEMTGADIAFVGERRGEAVQIRYIWGNDTDSLVDLPVPFGRGVGGLCASQRRVVVVRDYLRESTITHDFDSRVRAEGLKSVMAAPLILGDDIDGVLYVGMRQETGVSDSMQREVIRLADSSGTGLAISARAREMMDSAVSEDRRQLAVRLHDSVGQMLFGIGAAASDLRVATEYDCDLQERVKQLERQVQEAAATLRQAMNVWTVPPDERELQVSLAADVHAFEERSDVQARMLTLNEIPPLGQRKADALLLACREALLNVEKHAGANAVVVTLYSFALGVGVAVVDDGRGYRITDAAGIGLNSCRERLERMGGALTVSSNDDGPGTVLRAWLPC